MRRVKCRVTGESGDACDFYKASNGKYYKDKKTYDIYKENSEYRTKIFKIINEKLLGKYITNCGGLIGRNIKECGLDVKTIYDSIINQYKYIEKLISNSNEDDQNKIIIIFSVITKLSTRITYAGCYEIKNKITDKVYIGESLNLFDRFNAHISQLYNNNHHCHDLQDAFNEYKDISNFQITPLFLFTIEKNTNKEDTKHYTLYLEAAFFMKYKYKKRELYNTINPYIALKEGNVSLDGYTIDCKRVLKLLTEDKENILPMKAKELIEKDLKKHDII